MNTSRNLQQFQNITTGATMGRCIYLITSISHELENIWVDAIFAPSADC